MLPDVNICEFMRLGGVLQDVQGSTPQEIYKSVCSRISLPAGITSDQLYNALCKRESVLTTAVGNGIAIPHPPQPLIKKDSDQRVYVCYLKEPVDMKALDNKKVYVMFITLSSSVQTHLQFISKLAHLVQKSDFKRLLENHAGIEELLVIARKY